MKPVRTLFTTSRPRFWLYLAGPVLVGVTYGAADLAALRTPQIVALFLYFLVPANIYLYGINDIFDARIDRVNPKKHVGPERRYDGDRLTVAAVVFSGLLGLFLLPFLPTTSVPWVIGFLLLGFLYSVPPVRFKTTPILDSVSNGLYILPGIAGYVALAGELPPFAIIIGAWAWTMAMHTFSAIPDIGPDRIAGIDTTATLLGETHAIMYCTACWLVAAAGFGLVDWRAGLLLTLYPVLSMGLAVFSIDINRAYWWFPWINGLVGMMLTIAGLWGLVYA